MILYRKYTGVRDNLPWLCKLHDLGHRPGARSRGKRAARAIIQQRLRMRLAQDDTVIFTGNGNSDSKITV